IVLKSLPHLSNLFWGIIDRQTILILRRIAYGIPALVLAIFIILTASFWLVPTDRLNAVVENQLTEAFGQTVTVSGRPTVSLFPYLSVGFGPLRVTSGDDELLLAVERAHGRLSVTSLWEGRPALRYIDMREAFISLKWDETERLNWSTSGFFDSEKAAAPEEPVLKFPERLRYVALTDSTVALSAPGRPEPVVLNAVNGTVMGPPRRNGLFMDGSFVWRDETVTSKIELISPGRFMIGESSLLDMSLETEFAKASFRGDTRWQSDMRGDGVFEVSFDNPKQFMNWFGLKGEDLLPNEPLSVLGDGSFKQKTISLRPIAVRLGDGKADGRLDLDLSGGGLGLSGTLAFDTLSIASTPTEDPAQDENRSFLETALLWAEDDIKLDLRVSSETILFDDETFKDVALGLFQKDASFRMNIGSAELNGGRLSGEIAVDSSDVAKKMRANVTISDANVDDLEQITGLTLPFEGRVTASLLAEASGKEIPELEQSFALDVEASLNGGALLQIDLPALLAAGDGRKLDATAFNGDALSTQFERVQIAGSVENNGTFAIKTFQLSEKAYAVKASGRLDINTDQISIMGTIAPTAPAATSSAVSDASEGDASAQNQAPVVFTMGGSLSQPVVTSANNRPVKADQNLQ
ncbi:MAG: AsmA-like C-terminal region-containing protein, partial [Pseudomonadota bacterium]